MPRSRICLIARCSLVTVLALAGVAHAAPSPSRVAEQVDRLILEDLGLSPGELTPIVDDKVFLRRAHLDLVGSIPTREEVLAFAVDDHPKKRERLVRELLERPAFGQTQARYWRDVILSRRLEDRAMIAAGALEADLAQWVNGGRGWDEIATEFITATGSVREEGAAALVMAQDGRTEEIAAEVSRVFLGVQIQCAQCHDHPWDEWKREDFHELAAFFPRVGVRQVRDQRPPDFQVVVNDRRDRPRFRNRDNANRRGSPEHYMQDLERPDQPGERIDPEFFLTGFSQPVGTPDAERRAALAKEFTQNEWFATALVNRVWSELVGEGFYEPVDDLGPLREPSAPRAVERLSGAFAKSGYDLKWLYQTVMATDAYQRESRPRRAPDEPPFRASVAQPLRGDQLFDAILTTLDVDEENLQGLVRQNRQRFARQYGPRFVFNLAFGYDPSDPRDTVSATIPQALARMNTPQLNAAVLARGDTMLARSLARHPREEKGADQAIVEELYLSALSRKPTDQELQTALAYRDEAPYRKAAFEDLLWALLNSAEFSHRR